MAKPSVLQFHEFCKNVLKIELTAGQKVIAKIAFGRANPSDLSGEERTLALEMFGGVEQVSDRARKYVLLRLGRGSGKTTMCSAFAVYTAVTFDVSSAGPGSIPYVIVVAPDRETAKLSIRMAREMIRSNPALERLVVSDQDQLIQLRRPDGRSVRIESFAASRGGASVRGRDIMAFIFDEAEFFASNAEGAQKEYTVNDKDIFDAMTPRLMKGAVGMLISTPWPVETLMGTMFNQNWSKCESAVAIKAPTILVRGDDAHIREIIESESLRDPENARREFYCEVEWSSGGEFFDVNAFVSSKEDVKRFPLPYDSKYPVAVGCDLGFTRDSSAICVVNYDGKYYRLLFTEELRPKPGAPLKPSEVIKRFAEIAHRYGATGVVADSYYRESLKEHLEKHKLVVFGAPEGTKGKAEVFQRTRAVLHEGFCKIPEATINNRMIQQAKMITSVPSVGGQVTIKIPRKVGMGHGDIVSAWVLAVHRLAYSQVDRPTPVFQPGSKEWFEESQRRMFEYQEKLNANYLKKTEKEVKKSLDARTMRQFRNW